MDIKSIAKKFFQYIKKFIHFILPKKTEQENIIQYFLRQLLVSDSYGNPSITTTILYFVMIIIGVVVWAEVKNSFQVVEVLDKEKGILTKGVKGFSSEFLYLVMSIAVVITYFYRSRQDKFGSEEPGEVIPGSGIVEGIKAKLGSIIGK